MKGGDHVIVQEVSSMPDGTKIQIENWNEEYEFILPNSTLGTYPVSKVSLDGQFAPKRNQKLRVSFNFPSAEMARQAFRSLEKGNKQLIDFKEYINDSRKIECI